MAALARDRLPAGILAAIMADTSAPLTSFSTREAASRPAPPDGDPLAGDWSEGLPGPPRALAVPLPQSIFLDLEAPRRADTAAPQAPPLQSEAPAIAAPKTMADLPDVTSQAALPVAAEPSPFLPSEAPPSDESLAWTEPAHAAPVPPTAEATAPSAGLRPPAAPEDLFAAAPEDLFGPAPAEFRAAETTEANHDSAPTPWSEPVAAPVSPAPWEVPLDPSAAPDAPAWDALPDVPPALVPPVPPAVVVPVVLATPPVVAEAPPVVAPAPPPPVLAPTAPVLAKTAPPVLAPTPPVLAPTPPPVLVPSPPVLVPSPPVLVPSAPAHDEASANESAVAAQPAPPVEAAAPAESAWDAVPVEAAPAPDPAWDAAPPPAESTPEWQAETAASDFQEVKKPEAPAPDAAAADWSSLRSGPDWSTSTGTPAEPTPDAWGAPPPSTEPSVEWTAPAAPPPAEAEWSAPPPPAVAPQRSAPAPLAQAPAKEPAAPAPAWNAPAVGASALEQLDSEPPEPEPGAAKELFGSVPAGGSLSGEDDDPALGANDEMAPSDALGPPVELASPEEVLRPLDDIDHDDPDLPAPVAKSAPRAQPLAAWKPAASTALEVRGEHRVAVHTRGGRTLRGTIHDVDLSKSQFPLLPQGGGEAESIYHSDVKAIFFMLAPGEKPHAGDGGKVRVTFADGRVIEGTREGADSKHGFFLVPADATRTNTRRIYVAREATSAIEKR